MAPVELTTLRNRKADSSKGSHPGMSLPDTWSVPRRYRNTLFLNKTCQRERNLLPLQRLLTTIRYASLSNLNFIPYRQFSVYTDLNGLQSMIDGHAVEKSNEK